MVSFRARVLVVACSLVMGCRAPAVAPSPPSEQPGGGAVPALPDPPEESAETEVFLVLARRGRPAELRLRQPTRPRYDLITREELAAVLVRRRSRTVTLRYGKSVPDAERADLVAFLEDHGVEHIELTVAGPPPRAR